MKNVIGLTRETKLDTPCQDMHELDSLDKTWIILPRFLIGQKFLVHLDKILP